MGSMMSSLIFDSKRMDILWYFACLFIRSLGSIWTSYPMKVHSKFPGLQLSNVMNLSGERSRKLHWFIAQAKEVDTVPLWYQRAFSYMCVYVYTCIYIYILNTYTKTRLKYIHRYCVLFLHIEGTSHLPMYAPYYGCYIYICMYIRLYTI